MSIRWTSKATLLDELSGLRMQHTNALAELEMYRNRAWAAEAKLAGVGAHCDDSCTTDCGHCKGRHEPCKLVPMHKCDNVTTDDTEGA